MNQASLSVACVRRLLASKTRKALALLSLYLRRYSLAAMCGIAQEDDDGQHAVQEPQTQRQAPSRKLSNAEREMGVADMKGAPDEAALKQVWADYHAMAKNIGDRESCEFFTDCAKECKAAFQ